MRSALFVTSFVTFGLVAAVGCSDATPAGPRPDAGVEGTLGPPPDGGAPPPGVTWSPCPLHSEGDGPNAECATLAVPLDRKNPQGPTIDFFVKRYRPAGGKGLRALWMLQGGPGASGYVFERLSEAFATKFPDVDYYMPDHRGTGLSSRIGCPAEEAESSPGGMGITPEEWPSCLAEVKRREGDRLAAFTTTNAANDVGVAIERMRTPGQPTFVYGVSYGTYWAHRYLQLFPAQSDGVVFDSIAPQGTSLARQDADANEAAKDFFDFCGKDAFCRGKLGADPWAKVNALFTKLKAGHCSEIAIPEIPTHVLFRRAFGGLLMDAGFRQYIPAIVHRADRCEPKDVAALKVLVKNLTQEQPESLELVKWGWVLSNNVLFSELWESPSPTAAELARIREDAVASRDVTSAMDVNVGKWPTYTPDEYASTWADVDTPVLFLQGGLDPATLLRKARVAKEHFTRPHQNWVEVPTATHTVIASSATTEKRSCGTRIVMNFIEGPKAPLDTSCLSTLVPIDFPCSRTDLNQALFGTQDAWE